MVRRPLPYICGVANVYFIVIVELISLIPELLFLYVSS